MPDQARPTRSDTVLREASDHLFYELWMLDRTARLLALGVFGPGPATNTLLESFTVHARGLLQFFFPITPRPDDMLAVDFVSDVAAWESARGEMPEVLVDVAARVGKEVAHLTYGRLAVTDEIKPWRFVEVANAIHGIAATFQPMVRAGLLGPRWNANPGL